MGKERLVVRLGMHWGPAVQLIHHRGIQVGFSGGMVGDRGGRGCIGGEKVEAIGEGLAYQILYEIVGSKIEHCLSCYRE